MIMQCFKIQYSQICEYLGIFGNIPRSDPDTCLGRVLFNYSKKDFIFLEYFSVCG